MFENVRQSVRDAMNRASSPAEGRAVLALMREALVGAKLGVSQVRAAVDATRVHLDHERSELETARRRGRLASGIHDAETARIAERFALKHEELVAVLERKLEAQSEELTLAEQELEEMSEQFRTMSAGGGSGVGGMGGAAPDVDPSLDADLNGLRRKAEQSAREADADRRLQELKRRMGR
ncbi:MAG TPA: hypothetical protein VIC55_01565 [Gemmatimonadaceae bacterium]|jgi:hypothetical protein